MGAKTVIEWTDSTWSPIRARVKADAAKIAREKGYASLVQIAGKMAGRVGQHCEHVSPGCEHCYAETNNHRCLPGNGTGLPYDRRSRDLVEAFVDEKVLLQPLRWGKIAAHSEPCTMKETKTKMCQCPWHSRRIFVENQSDLFGEWVTDEILDRVFAVMALCPQHIFQVLTKRPERMLHYLSDTNMRLGFGLGVDVITRIANKADKAPVEIRQQWPLPNVWLGTSVENQITADKRRGPMSQLAEMVWTTFVSYEPAIEAVDWKGWEFLFWLISGGESGREARPSHPDCHRKARDFCAAQSRLHLPGGIPYFFKQWGDGWRRFNDCEATQAGFARGEYHGGALLDGVEHKYFP